MTLVSSPQTAPTAPGDHRKNSRRFGTGLSQIWTNESPSDDSSTELGSTNFTDPKTFWLHGHDTALAECVYRLISTLIMFMESGLQEIGHSRSHSCSPAPEEAWIEPGKCQISLKSVRIWRHFAHFSDSWGLSQASKKCFFDQNHNSVLIEVYFNNMTLVSSPQTAPKAPTDHRNNSRCFGTAKSQDPGFGSGSDRK